MYEAANAAFVSDGVRPYAPVRAFHFGSHRYCRNWMTAPIDFAALFGRSPNAYMVLDRDLRFVAANDAYLKVTAMKLENLLGHHVFEAFPNDIDDPANLPRRMLRDSFLRVLQTGETDTLAFIPYRVPKPG